MQKHDITLQTIIEIFENLEKNKKIEKTQRFLEYFQWLKCSAYHATPYEAQNLTYRHKRTLESKNSKGFQNISQLMGPQLIFSQIA